MLATQIQFLNYKEQQRHNLMTESQNSIQLGIQQGTLDESVRHNKVNEEVGWFNAQETKRHNQVGENISYFNAMENARHNLVTEDQGQQVINETVRHNKVWENETHRHNVVFENETHRHNVQQENIGFANISLGYANLAEASRHNRASEEIGATQAMASMTQAAAARTNAANNTREVTSRIRVNQAQIDRYNAQNSLDYERAVSEPVQRDLNRSQELRNYTSIPMDLFKTVLPAFQF
jgi:hypothetical protein